MSVLESLAVRFPQLYLTPAPGMRQNLLYRAIVGRGTQYHGDLSGFLGSENDRFWVEQTPAGSVEVLYLYERSDFERFYRIMGCRCEPVLVPPSMGASTLLGLTNWRRIEAHREAYLASGGADWEEELQRCKQDKSTYCDTLVLLSDGGYSGLSAAQAGFPEKEWIRLSLAIRTRHELTHVVCRRLYPNQKHAVWDELLADAMGITYALGAYDSALAKAVLGVTSSGLFVGGRLENYVPPEAVERYAAASAALIDRLALDIPALGFAPGDYACTISLMECASEYCSLLENF